MRAFLRLPGCEMRPYFSTSSSSLIWARRGSCLGLVDLCALGIGGKMARLLFFFSCLDILGLGCLVSCRDVQRTRANPSLSISLQMAPSTNVDPVSFDFCLLYSYNINPWTYATLLYILTSAVVIPASVIVMSQLLPAELVLA